MLPLSGGGGILSESAAMSDGAPPLKLLGVCTLDGQRIDGFTCSDDNPVCCDMGTDGDTDTHSYTETMAHAILDNLRF